ncbi:hypothetical protein [Streptomyces bambusae]|uniref:hypothetical protein n=1 Tax=Streptomyces bambusae TaxID=1550616 RepID=UPI001CA578A1|nr:hypothetical protein [Streptomyces bambusae]
MSRTSAAPQSAQEQQKPGWTLVAFLVGAVCAVLRFVDIWSWWALLWAPLLAFAAAATAYEWRVLARQRWRMGPVEWVFLGLTHLGCVAALIALCRAAIQ